MAGLTKEQRAQRAAEQTASTQADNNEPVSTTSQLVAMVTDFPAFPGGPIPPTFTLMKWRTGRRTAGKKWSDA